MSEFWKDCAIAYQKKSEQLQKRNAELREALKDALEWNWCDEDYPEDLYEKYMELTQESEG